LGALIPANPLGNSGGRGHFWNALDNPPKGGPVDTDLVKSTAVPTVPPQEAESPEQPESGTRVGGTGQGLGQADPPVDNATEKAAGQEQNDAVVHSENTAVDNIVSRETGDETSTNSSVDPDSPGQVREDSAEPEPQALDGLAVLIEIDPALILPNPKNPRSVFDEDDLAELAASIKDFGLLQPIVVRSGADGDTYELIMGERRLRAAKLAGVDSIPAIVRQTEDDAMLRDALLENIHRVQLNPLEEAAAYQQLIEEFDVTHDELAHRIKRSRSQISNMLRLMKLPPRVQQRVAAGVLSYGHARAILGLDDPDQQEALATRVVAEGMSVRATEEAVSLAGSDQPRQRGARRKQITAPALRTLAENLSDYFDTRATVQLGRSKGKIVVEFGSIDDLERIVAIMAPKYATNRATEGPEESQ